MAQPVYKLWLSRPSEAWYQLSEDEQQQLIAKVNEAREQVGGKLVVFCNSQWASEQWFGWGVEQFPDLEAVQKFTERLNEFNWSRYGESWTILGTEFQPTE